MKGLVKDPSSQAAIQAFAPRQGQCNLTASATLWTGSVTECVVAGDLTFTFPNGGTETLSYLVGSNHAIPIGCTVTIVSGTFHIS